MRTSRCRLGHGTPTKWLHNVESHIQASDAARQEVKKLQGTINRSTTEAVTVEKASRATIKASEAQDERHKAEKAATADER